MAALKRPRHCSEFASDTGLVPGPLSATSWCASPCANAVSGSTPMPLAPPRRAELEQAAAAAALSPRPSSSNLESDVFADAHPRFPRLSVGGLSAGGLSTAGTERSESDSDLSSWALGGEAAGAEGGPRALSAGSSMTRARSSGGMDRSRWAGPRSSSHACPFGGRLPDAASPPQFGGLRLADSTTPRGGSSVSFGAPSGPNLHLNDAAWNEATEVFGRSQQARARPAWVPGPRPLISRAASPFLYLYCARRPYPHGCRASRAMTSGQRTPARWWTLKKRFRWRK